MRRSAVLLFSMVCSRFEGFRSSMEEKVCGMWEKRKRERRRREIEEKHI